MLAGHPSSRPTWRWSACPTPPGVRWSARWWWPARSEQAPTLDELRALCAGRLATFKHPREVRVVDALPRTASTGQVQRRLLVDRLRLG